MTKTAHDGSTMQQTGPAAWLLDYKGFTYRVTFTDRSANLAVSFVGVEIKKIWTVTTCYAHSESSGRVVELPVTGELFSEDATEDMAWRLMRELRTLVAEVDGEAMERMRWLCEGMAMPSPVKANWGVGDVACVPAGDKWFVVGDPSNADGRPWISMYEADPKDPTNVEAQIEALDEWGFDTWDDARSAFRRLVAEALR